MSIIENFLRVSWDQIIMFEPRVLADYGIDSTHSNRTRRSSEESTEIVVTTGDTYEFHTVVYDMRRYDSLNIDASGLDSDLHLIFGPQCYASYRNVYALDLNFG